MMTGFMSTTAVQSPSGIHESSSIGQGLPPLHTGICCVSVGYSIIDGAQGFQIYPDSPSFIGHYLPALRSNVAVRGVGVERKNCPKRVPEPKPDTTYTTTMFVAAPAVGDTY